MFSGFDFPTCFIIQCFFEKCIRPEHKKHGYLSTCTCSFDWKTIISPINWYYHLNIFKLSCLGSNKSCKHWFPHSIESKGKISSLQADMLTNCEESLRLAESLQLGARMHVTTITPGPTLSEAGLEIRSIGLPIQSRTVYDAHVQEHIRRKGGGWLNTRLGQWRG